MHYIRQTAPRSFLYDWRLQDIVIDVFSIYYKRRKDRKISCKTAKMIWTIASQQWLYNTMLPKYQSADGYITRVDVGIKVPDPEHRDARHRASVYSDGVKIGCQFVPRYVFEYVADKLRWRFPE